MTESRAWVATPGEAGAVARLLAAFRDWWGHEEPADADILRDVERLIEDEDTEFLLGAVDAGEAVGFVQLRFRYAIWRQSPDCTLEDLYVADQARGAGLGEALVRLAIERAAARGAVQIDLDTDEDNADARRQYERCGFSAAAKTGEPGLCLFYRWRADAKQP